MRAGRRIACVILLWSALTGAQAQAADGEQSHSFKLTVASKLDTEIQGKQQKLDLDTSINYTWKLKGRERTLSFGSTSIKSRVDGK